MKKLLLVSALAFGFAGSVQAADYVVDTQGAHASINFKVSHLGYSWLHGRFDKFSGKFNYDSANLAASKITIDIDTSSVNSNHAERDKHIRSADFLNVDKSAKASFVSSKVVPKADGKFDLVGNFTLNGVTKEITIAASKTGEGKDPWGGYRAGFEGTTEIKMADYGIKYNLGPASEVVYLNFVIEGVRQ